MNNFINATQMYTKCSNLVMAATNQSKVKKEDKNSVC